jgi:hypothetical protein
MTDFYWLGDAAQPEGWGLLMQHNGETARVAKAKHPPPLQHPARPG